MKTKKLKIEAISVRNSKKVLTYLEEKFEDDVNEEIILNELFKFYETRRYFFEVIQIVEKSTDISNYVKNQTLFLNEKYDNVSIEQRIYHIYHNYIDIKYCEICNKPSKFGGFTKNKELIPYNSTCGNLKCINKLNANNLVKAAQKYGEGITNIGQSDHWHKKIKETNNERYGTDWQTQTQNFKDKSKITCVEKYGEEHHLRNKDILQKQKDTNLEKYGYNFLFENVELREQKMIAKYGVINYLQTDWGKKKIIKTNQEKYGVNWYCETDDCQEHNNNWKYVEINRKIFKVQGYEDKFLKEYFDNGGDETNIFSGIKLTEQIGMIWYHTPDGIKHRYIPDFYLKNEHKIIEVKSQWTYDINKEINEIKKQACLDIGLNFEFKIY